MTDRQSPVDIHVGSRVRMLRMVKTFSREKLADSLNIETEEMAALERGDTRFGPTLLQDVADILGYTVADFFLGFDSGLPIIPSTVPDDGTMPGVAEVQQMVDTFVQIRSQSFREGLLRQAQAAAEVTSAAPKID